MYRRKLMEQQLYTSGVRLGDSCSIFPFHGRRKAFTLKSKKIDLISSHYRPKDLSMSYIELPKSETEQFHYRLELENSPDQEGRFVLKTLEGRAFWLNGLAAKEAYVERQDRLFIDDNKINFAPFDLREFTSREYEHPLLMEQNLINSELKILITGETGTGKSHLAEKIHQKSRRLGEFVAINLSSFNPQLIESELFGHKKGSFTGAVNDKRGAFSMAENGTLFLDEIDSLPLDLQTKLLTFIDNKKFRRVGDTREETIKTRMIFASGRSLQLMVDQGIFRKDLYFRLKSGHSVELVSLRNDVKRIKEICQQFSMAQNVTLSQNLLDFYQTLAWPGNIRQLQGHLEKKKVLSRSFKLDFDHFDEELLLQSSDLMNLDVSREIIPLESIKANYIKRALSLCEGNIAMAARRLQLNEKTVRALILKD
ncbi:MAG: sigma-54 factor interaction domain-containing protein [Bdellovibrionales bacterium]|nr:sigma-54 factor interaction domain-containing protein [Bdellovibrionales bacterium]